MNKKEFEEEIDLYFLEKTLKDIDRTIYLKEDMEIQNDEHDQEIIDGRE